MAVAQFDVDRYWERLEAAVEFVDYDDELLRFSLKEFIEHVALLNADMVFSPWRRD